MPTRFIIGRSGSGKTAWCFDQVLRAHRAEPLGPPILWILPRQATFQAERALACAAGGYFRVQVLSFELLGERILADCGSGQFQQVTDLGRQMILGHLLRKLQPSLKFFSAAARQPGLAAELNATFTELERCGQDAAVLPRLVAEGDAADPSDAAGQALLAKLHDLQQIYTAYAAFLGQDRLDPNRRLQQALECIRQSPLLRSAEVYVDGFYDFSDYERRVLAGLGETCRSVAITLPMDPASSLLRDPHKLPDELSVFHRTEEAYRRLWFVFNEAGVTLDPPVLLKEIRRFSNPALAALERWTISDEIGRTSATDIQLIEAPDRRAEVDAAARAIRELLASGFRLRDVAVLVRSIDDYHELIDASFREHRLPYFVDRRRTAAHHPLFQFLRAALLVVRHRWPHEAVMTLAKSGLSTLSTAEADELENYVLLHGIRHGTWTTLEPWTGRRTIRAETADDAMPAPRPEPHRADALRRKFIAPFLPLIESLNAAPSLPLRKLVTALLDLLERLGVRNTIAGWMQAASSGGRIEQQEEHAQVWAELMKMLDELVATLGEEEVTLADFQAILDTGLERFDLALTPPTVDQVLVGEVDRTRTPVISTAIVLGLNQEQFPRSAREDSVFSDSDRRLLRRRDVKLEADTQRRLLDEEFLGYIAMTRASSRLILTRAVADESGKAQQPSVFWRRVRQTFPDIDVTRLPRPQQQPVEMIATPRQLVTSLMRWVRGACDDSAFATDGDSNPWPRLFQWLAAHECCDDTIDIMRYRSWKALSYSNDARLSPEIAGRLFPRPLEARVSELETFRNCPFQHFLRYGLHLRERGDERVTAQDLSHVYHEVLEKLLRELLSRRKEWLDLPPSEAEAMIRSMTLDVGRELRGELMLSSARNQYLLNRIEKMLASVVAAQQAARQRGKFRPVAANIAFGEGGKLPPLVVHTPAGNDVHLSGKIDRIDATASGHAAVVDYKLSGNALDMSGAYYGMSLQLLTYLLVLQHCGQELAGQKLTPAAAFYVKLLRHLGDSWPSEALEPDDPRFHLMVKPRGIFDANHVASLDTQLTGGRSDVVEVHVNKDGGFGFRNRTDVALPDEFAALLAHVERRLGELADEILAGVISISPYRIGKKTPCPRCEYRDVCRFDPVANGYVELRPMKREDILANLAQDAGPSS